MNMNIRLHRLDGGQEKAEEQRASTLLQVFVKSLVWTARMRRLANVTDGNDLTRPCYAADIRPMLRSLREKILFCQAGKNIL